jgi:hypothetical protein
MTAGVIGANIGAGLVILFGRPRGGLLGGRRNDPIHAFSCAQSHPADAE